MTACDDWQLAVGAMGPVSPGLEAGPMPAFGITLEHPDGRMAHFVDECVAHAVCSMSLPKRMNSQTGCVAHLRAHLDATLALIGHTTVDTLASRLAQSGVPGDGQ